MRIQKVKYKKGKVEIHYLYKREDKETELVLRSDEEPIEDFKRALEDLREFVVEICELGNVSLEKIDVTGVSFSWSGEEEAMGATIIAQRSLQYSNAPLNLVTPHKIENISGNIDPLQEMNPEMKDALEELIAQAKNYIDGDRRFKQLELEFETA